MCFQFVGSLDKQRKLPCQWKEHTDAPLTLYDGWEVFRINPLCRSLSTCPSVTLQLGGASAGASPPHSIKGAERHREVFPGSIGSTYCNETMFFKTLERTQA